MVIVILRPWPPSRPPADLAHGAEDRPLCTALARGCPPPRTSYEARGAIYDRALAIVMERLGATVPPPSQADIDQELLAFRAAVRRIEFGDMDEQDRVAQDGVAQRAQYLASRREQRQNETPRLDAYPAVLPDEERQTVAVAEMLPATEQEAAVLADMALPRSVLQRVAMRMVLPVLLVALGLAGYAYGTGQIEQSFVGQILSRIAPTTWLAAGEGTPEPVEEATYHEQASGKGPWKEFNGSARWRTRIEDAASGSRSTVIALDLLVPERGLAMVMAIRRDASEDAAMTHLLEFKFSDRRGAPLEGIAGVSNIVMKQVDGSRGSALAGLSIKVAPGVFLFGLSADKDDARHNAEALRTLSRLDIPITFADGSAATITLNKGESGERVFDAALADWER
jgi:hypothetical protein